MAQPGDQRRGKSESADGSRTGEDQAFCQQLAHDAQPAGAERGAHGELLGARGGTGKKKIGEINAGNEENASDGRPENDERSAQLAADVFLERDRNHSILGVAFAGIRIFVVPAHVGRGGGCVRDSLPEGHAGFETAIMVMMLPSSRGGP